MIQRPVLKSVRFTEAEFARVEAAILARGCADVSDLLRQLVTEDRSVDAQRLRRAREALGWGQRKLARVLGYDNHAIVGQMERGLIPLKDPARVWLEEQEGRRG